MIIRLTSYMDWMLSCRKKVQEEKNSSLLLKLQSGFSSRAHCPAQLLTCYCTCSALGPSMILQMTLCAKTSKNPTSLFEQSVSECATGAAIPFLNGLDLPQQTYWGGTFRKTATVCWVAGTTLCLPFGTVFCICGHTYFSSSAASCTFLSVNN